MSHHSSIRHEEGFPSLPSRCPMVNEPGTTYYVQCRVSKKTPERYLYIGRSSIGVVIAFLWPVQDHQSIDHITYKEEDEEEGAGSTQKYSGWLVMIALGLIKISQQLPCFFLSLSP